MHGTVTFFEIDRVKRKAVRRRIRYRDITPEGFADKVKFISGKNTNVVTGTYYYRLTGKVLNAN